MPGATDDVCEAFLEEIGQPLTAQELAEIRASQSNPFFETDPLYASWEPLDPVLWPLPQRPLPPAYLSLLQWSNGGEFRTGERWFQFFPTHDLRPILLSYCLPEYMPYALPFAFNGSGTFYLFDLRSPAVDGEYPIVCAHAGNLGWEPEACFALAGSFITLCQGTLEIDKLRHGSGGERGFPRSSAESQA